MVANIAVAGFPWGSMKTVRHYLVPALLVRISVYVSPLTGDLTAIGVEGTVYQCAVVYVADGLRHAPYIMPYITA